MDSQREQESFIITSSDINHRTSAKEKLWSSYKSGMIKGTNDVDNIEIESDLSTVNEEDPYTLSDQETESIEKEDILNTNIDAIDSDDEVFFDCNSPAYSPRYSPKKKRSPSRNFRIKYGNSLTVNDGGIDGIRTCVSLAEMMKDFNNTNCMSQSTPIFSTDKHFSDFIDNISSTDQASANVPADDKKSSSVSENLQQNHLRTKNLKINIIDASPSTVSKRKLGSSSKNRKSEKENSSPSKWKPAGRVAKLKEVFEKCQNSNTVPKLIITPDKRSRYISPARKNSLSIKPFSLDYSSKSPKIRSFKRSHSLGEDETESEINTCELKKATVSTKTFFSPNRKITLNVNSPKKNKSSGIMNRRSVAKVAKSPIPPVRELRKFFSPSSEADATNEAMM